MGSLWTVARKELRTWFQSPVALLFLGVFLVITLFTFFETSGFFARKIADVRPLFAWLPLLLIFLVSAITMRQWAEEQKMGTLEVLLTLPLKTRDLVLGKFVAGLLLVALALALTLPLPLMVGYLGDIDWGPVIGGYVGALCLSALYLSIGLCVSARTDNQVVALMVTLLLGGILYLLGTDAVVGLFGNQGAEILRAIGTGSRFESIERGVVDLRDLFYYASLSAFFLVMNAYFLEVRRLDRGSENGRRRGMTWLLVLTLAGANAITGNVWLAPVRQVRLDLTQGRDYSVSEVTRNTLAGLDEPLIIEGYFSDRTHPLLAPLIPQIKDMLEEYQVQGGGKVKVSFMDPTKDPEVEQRINEDYAIKSVPFRVDDPHEQAVVNSYFAILIKYGDKYETLSFQDMIEVQPEEDHVDVKLRDLEYDLTRAIRRVSSEFQSVSSLLQKLPEGSMLTLYVTPSSLPADAVVQVELARKIGRDIAGKSGGKLTFAEVDPTSDAALPQALAQKYGIQPMAADLFATQRFYLDVLLSNGDPSAKATKGERVALRPGMADADLENAIQAAVKRVTPGQLKAVGLVTAKPEPPPQNPNMPPQMQPPTPDPDYRTVEQVLGGSYEVHRLDLLDGQVPDDVQTLLVAKIGNLSDKQQFAIDQFLMRGGAVIVLDGRYEITVDRGGLRANKTSGALADMLQAWGVKIDDALVLDPQNASFPVPVQERRGPIVLQRVQMLPYPFFADIRGAGLDRTSPTVAGVENVTTPWASPIEVVADPAQVQVKEFLKTSDQSWVASDGNINPDMQKFPDVGFGVTGTLGSRTVGVVLTGKFKSFFKDKDAPATDDESGAKPRKLDESPEDARLAVVSTSEIGSDLMAQIAQSPGGEMHRGDIQLVQNLVDWSVEDTDLLTIRSAGAFSRTLRPMTESEKNYWEFGQYGFALGMLGIVALVPWQRRRSLRPIRLQGLPA